MTNIKLVLGDFLNVVKTIEDESIDLVIADPPYTMTKRGKSCRPNWMPHNMGENVFSGKVPIAQDWMKECFRVLKNKTHLYVFCNTNDIQSYLNSATEVGFKLHNIITMIKDTGMPNRWYLKNCELVLFFRKGKAKPINDMTSRDWANVKMPTLKNGKIHITQKPLDFIQKLVTNSTIEGETVLDPFFGSGTTALACKNTNRKFVGSDTEEKYVRMAKDRLDE